MEVLTPLVRFEGKEYIVLTPQLAGIAASDRGTAVGELIADREAIIAALDLLITGI